MTRVTQVSLNATFLRNLNLVARRLELNQTKLTTGLNFQRPSDGPLAINRILGYRTQLTAISQFQANVDDGLTQVDFVDSRLQSVVETIRESRTLGIQGANGTLARADRASIAGQLDQYLRDLGLTGNSALSGRFLFAGTETLRSPFEQFDAISDGYIEDVLYRGNQQTIERRIGGAARFGVNFTGDEIFLEQTATRTGKALPLGFPLGFSGNLVINDKEIAIAATDTLRDIERRINLTPELGASARIRSGSLEVYSDYAVREVEFADDQDGQLLQSLGLSLRGAYTTAQVPIDPLNFPLADSTPAIFTGAGPVASLEINGNNDILNVHLGANANEGTAVSHVIRIPHGFYQNESDLADAIQEQIDLAFGRNKVVIDDVGGALELRTYRNGATIGTADLQIGGLIDGTVDTASDSATLNLVAAPGPTPLTNATTPGADGLDRFSIDLGPLATPSGEEQGPIEIDLRGANTGSLSDLINEINAQIRADVRLRGAVTAQLVDGRIEFETTTKGGNIDPSQLALADLTPGILATLGGFAARPATLTTTGSPTLPLVTTPTFREFTLDLGPSVSRSGIQTGPLSMVLALGSYPTSQDVVNALNNSLNQQPEVFGQVQFETLNAAPNSPIVLRTVGQGSQYAAEDLVLGGPLFTDLGFATATPEDGAGVAPGEGTYTEPRNLFRDMIGLRDALLDIADDAAIAKELTTVAGEPLGLFDGDDITVTANGTTYVFQHRAGETLGDVVAEIGRILGSQAEVSLGRDGRIAIRNEGLGAITGFSITASSPTGIPRAVFNGVLGELPATLPIGTELRSGAMLDPRRAERANTIELGRLDLDLENVLAIESLVGARSNRLQLTTSLLLDSTANIRSLRTSLEAVNVPEIITQLSADQATLEAALQIGSRVLQPSLISFLR